MLRAVRTHRFPGMPQAGPGPGLVSGESDRPATDVRVAAGQAAAPRLSRAGLPPTSGQIAWTCSACGPFGPWRVVYSTFWFSSRLR